MKTDAVRRMDELGRITIPIEMRNALGWDNKTKISISRDGTQLVLDLYEDSCMVCASEENLKEVHGKYICQKCIEEIKQYS
ncbi:MAG: AbrB/MazE/SpoVT family DNA-binding domain-containing protein [Bacillota bacterium]|nr:AbrB/MazE/SpoVT family DNA-binding domain-containing protein [Bacillota bacterium]